LTTLRRLPCWLAVAGLLLACPWQSEPAPGQSQGEPPDRLQQWLDAIEAHTPGDPGKVAVEVSTWSGSDLEAVIAEAKRHARGLAKSDPEGANQVLLRGAALHADIARLIPEDTVRRSPSQKTTYIARDGRWLGIRYVSMHWQLGRSLLDAVVPTPANHAGVREWYVKTSADLLELRQLAAAVDHYVRARQLFPSDPVILFASGALHERFASSALQAAAESVVESNRASAAVTTARGELGRAERFFRESLIARPHHIEARLRRGRVLDELGRHEEAVTELRRAIHDGASGALLYLAHLFLGRAEESLGRETTARQEFERASALYPNAQSPRLALSQIARRAGNRSAAQRELQAIAKLPADDRRREDPWWLYYDMR
jgi:tetratricopeptide (TPR) repeat protein